jgi:hypothetical protein
MARRLAPPVATRDDLTLFRSSPKNNPMPSTGESKRVRRPGMGAASLLLLAAQILSLGHLLVVRHATCPEHGDVMHAEQRPEARVARFDADEGRASQVGSVSKAETGHDHCLICTLTHERFALLPPAGTSAIRIEIAIRIASGLDIRPFAPVAVIAFSPKNSPPSA